MLRGDLSLANTAILAAVDKSLREAWLSTTAFRQVDWKARIWQPADIAFNEGAAAVTAVVLQRFSDRGPCEYLEGKLAKEDWDNIEAAVKFFFQKLSPPGKLFKERIKLSLSMIDKFVEAEVKRHGIARRTKG